ncbi:MAG: thioredoxin family protein [Cyclobacteriaceae bacterium]
MQRLTLLIVTLLIQITAYAQLNWIHDLRAAQALSLSEKKLIVMDFWAIWCSPCREMDHHLWNHEEMATLSNNFIPLKVDIDHHRDLAQKYAANAIPKVVITDANGTVIWEEVGFQNVDYYLDILKNLPTDQDKLNKCLIPI